MTDWLTITCGEAPLIVSLPHTGTKIPAEYEGNFVSSWIALRDTDWWIHHLYDFAAIELNATVVRTSISRSVIDVNRDPSGASLYPGQATTALCPITTFDGDPLYKEGRSPDEAEIAQRRSAYFEPYHVALAGEIARLRAKHPHIVIYDCHSIRSAIPRLFEGVLPEFNIGTNDGASCAPELARRVVTLCAETGRRYVLNGRFKGGWITRHHASPSQGVHALQMEIACRAYMREPTGAVHEGSWPEAYDPELAAPLRESLRRILSACLDFARTGAP
ncbi:MAG: N-formylglutamate deformylase [Xanthobacteraceae bacterium]|nr:N-formylglutamate deformylase [Xanthobacteraceae bacterium]